MKQVRVNHPDFKDEEAISDMIVTHCCSFAPSYYVEFPNIEERYVDRSGEIRVMPYGSYFNIEIVKAIKGSECGVKI